MTAAFWTPTHFSVGDGSPIRVIFEYVEKDVPMVVCENECGDQWVDPASSWEPAF